LNSLNEFILPVRVYYEDTDAGGVVYHASYLRFMERARTEWLRALGFEQDVLIREYGILFAVRNIGIDYRKPARFNEQLFVTVTVALVGKASLTFAQTIWRATVNGEQEHLTTATVKVACIQAVSFKPAAIPTVIRDILL
jgi:acyl-CoA thioester hydrolase